MPISVLTDLVEVLVYDRQAGPVLVGAVELASPANKDRPGHRDAFVSKCAAYLQQGIGLVVVDIVTGGKADLHEALVLRLGAPRGTTLPAEIYVAAYRPVERAGQPSLDIWQEPLTLNGPLPTLPLWLRGGLCLPVELEATYERTCEEQRIDADG